MFQQQPNDQHHTDGDSMQSDYLLQLEAKVNQSDDRQALDEIVNYFFQHKGINLTPTDGQRVLDLLIKFEENDANIQRQIGSFYHFGKCHLPVNFEESLVWYKKSANNGNRIAMYNVGLMYDRGNGCVKDVKEAFSWFLRAAVAGHGLSQYYVGVMLDRGEGCEGDIQQAIYWLNQSCMNGCMEGTAYLATIYEQGRENITMDYSKAFPLFLKASQLGDIESMFYVGVMYLKGRGVDLNYELALEFFLMAANRDHVSAQYNAGSMYDKGMGCKQDLKKAFELFMKGAMHGHPICQFYVGNMLLSGEGTVVDRNRAIFWMRQAAQQGIPDAIEFVNSLDKRS